MDKKTRNVNFRLTAKEYERLAEQAEKEYLTIPSYIRQKIGLACDRASELEKMVKELEKKVKVLEKK